MAEKYISYAYTDKAFPIDESQTISQPYTVSYQTQLLNIQPNEKVLEIGTSSGYQCIILCEIGAKEFSIERNKILHEKGAILLDNLNYHPTLFLADGSNGFAEFCPFDKIIVTASYHQIPPKLIDELEIGGKLVMPLGPLNSQKMFLFDKILAKNYIQSENGSLLFIRLIKGDLARFIRWMKSY